MDLDDYQVQALETDNTQRNYEGDESRKDLVVALLGIAGELGTLATAYKKFLRDGPAYKLYSDNVKEELGDLLWYLAVLANKFGLSLSEIASGNLLKTKSRWGTQSETLLPPYDSGFPETERLPRKFLVSFSEKLMDGKTKVILEVDGQPLGSELTDNARYEDGYRFHDAFHLAYAVVLGWSPVLRKLMGRKRRSDARVDETEDGGRALVIEEGIAAYVFEYGEDHQSLEGIRAVDFEVLKTVKSMTQRLEVSSKSWSDWERAIRAGYKVFRQLKEHHRGWVECDLDAHTINFSLERPASG